MENIKKYSWLVLIIIIILLTNLATYLYLSNNNPSASTIADQCTPAEDTAESCIDPAKLNSPKLLAHEVKEELVEELYSCDPSEFGSPNESTYEMKIDGDLFCVSTVGEGAAGHSLTSYTYSIAEDDIQRSFSFSTDFPSSCNMFEGDAALSCEEEKAAFNADKSFSEYYKGLKTSVNRSEDKFTSSTHGFELLLPKHTTVREVPGGHARNFLFSLYDTNYSVVILGDQDRDKSYDFSEVEVCGSTPTSEIDLNGQKAYYYESEAQEYIEGPQEPLDCINAPAVNILTVANGFTYALHFPGDTVLDETENEIVNSFRIIELE